MTSQYHFLTRWRVAGTPEEIFAILSEPEEYPRWWPSVYLMVREVAPGDRNGLGRRIRLLTKGWLPYQLDWEASTTAAQPPNRLVVEASGDFEGRGIWSILPDGAGSGVGSGLGSDVTFDWKLKARKPLLRYLTPLLRSAFEANHRWAMGQGLRSLNLELARYRAKTVEEMNAVPAPAGPRELWTRAAATGAVLAAGLVAGLLTTAESPAKP